MDVLQVLEFLQTQAVLQGLGGLGLANVVDSAVLHVELVGEGEACDEAVAVDDELLDVEGLGRLEQVVVVKGLQVRLVHVWRHEGLVEVVGEVDALGQVVFVVDADLLGS